jgi:hypothetical protein
MADAITWLIQLPIAKPSQSSDDHIRQTTPANTAHLARAASRPTRLSHLPRHIARLVVQPRSCTTAGARETAVAPTPDSISERPANTPLRSMDDGTGVAATPASAARRDGPRRRPLRGHYLPLLLVPSREQAMVLRDMDTQVVVDLCRAG